VSKKPTKASSGFCCVGFFVWSWFKAELLVLNIFSFLLLLCFEWGYMGQLTLYWQYGQSYTVRDVRLSVCLSVRPSDQLHQ